MSDALTNPDVQVATLSLTSSACGRVSCSISSSFELRFRSLRHQRGHTIDVSTLVATRVRVGPCCPR